MLRAGATHAWLGKAGEAHVVAAHQLLRAVDDLQDDCRAGARRASHTAATVVEAGRRLRLVESAFRAAAPRMTPAQLECALLGVRGSAPFVVAFATGPVTVLVPEPGSTDWDAVERLARFEGAGR